MQLPPSGGMGGASSGDAGHGDAGYYTPPAGTGSRPAVIVWYRVYALVIALLYGALTCLIASFNPDGYTLHNIVVGIVATTPVLVGGGLGVAIPYKPWGWSYGVVMIALGALSCFAPLSVILMIFWRRPEVKAAFGRL